VNVGLSFVRGMIAAVNPCGFVLLPTYLLYFLGLEAGRGPAAAGTERATVRRALLVGGAVSLGFMAVFVVVGAVTSWFTSWLIENAKWFTGVAGVGFVLLGVAMLFGFKPTLALPGVASVGERDRTVRSMFVYGIVYAVVSLSCTLALFVPMLFNGRGFVGGVVNGAAFGLGMGLLVTALTVSLAIANQALLRVLRSTMQHVQLLAAAFILLSGCYLLYYFWVVDVNGDSGVLDDAVGRFQNRIVVWLNDHWRAAALVMGVIVGAAIAYVGLRRRPSAEAPLASPEREREPTP
jgi:cytochrome c biogenesis protein CcdA